MSQEYTPVVWVDETAGQPGTLINKARLDQMQSAHHFADGFKEVDTVPTADPGVDYHMVVFCTADTTFYRWDGSAWVKDVDDETKALLLAHEADHNNPHVVTKAQVGLGNVDNTSDADKPVSDAAQAALDAKVDDSQIVSTWSQPLSNDNIPGEKLVKDALDGKMTANAPITPGTKTKITYDAKGLVTAGADLLASDIPDIAISQVDGLQTALDGKVTIIPVTSGVKFYSQSSGGTTLYQGTSSPVTGITSVPLRDSSGRIKTAAPSANEDAANKKYVDDADALKLDDSQLVSSWQATPDNDHIASEKLTKDSLDLKINTSALVSAWQVSPDDDHIPSEKLVKTYIDTSLTDGSVTKIGTATVGGDLKPVYLNAGVPTAVANDLVSTTGYQVIAGHKAFIDTASFSQTTALIIRNTSITTGTIPSTSSYRTILYCANSGTTNHGYITFLSQTDGQTRININARDYNGANEGELSIFSGTDKHVTAPVRTYSASNTSDVVTIGSLQASTDVVHTAGNETINGVKSFQYDPKQNYIGTLGTGGWQKVGSSEASVIAVYRTTIINVLARETAAYLKIILRRRTLTQNSYVILYNTFPANSIIITRDSNGVMTLWIDSSRLSAWIDADFLSNATPMYANFVLKADDTAYTEPQAADYEYLVKI